MTAHILNTAIDPKYPATLSEATIENLLRQELRFNKLVFADDMEMKAISEHFGIDEAPVLAINAGCDLLIYRNESIAPERAVEAVIKAVENKTIPMEKIERAIARIYGAKKAYCDVSRPLEVTDVSKFIGLPEHFQLADVIQKREMPPEQSA